MIEENFIKIYEKSFKENWDLPALTDYNTRETFTYGEVAEQIARLHLLFKYCQIRRGDKIALVGRNTPRWCIAFMAAVSYGAIIVPILQDFNANDVQHIVNHSDSVLLFAGDLIWENLEVDKLSQLRGIILVLISGTENVLLNVWVIWISCLKKHILRVLRETMSVLPN